MTTINKLLASKVEIVDYNPAWPKIYAAERAILLARTDPHFVRFEHVGSTAIPGQRAKPIIDMMVAINKLDELAAFQAALVELGYELFDVGMHERYFLENRLQMGRFSTCTSLNFQAGPSAMSALCATICSSTPKR